MARNIIVTPLSHRPIEEREVELCEHKGIGHPDTITDTVCEAASLELSLAYLKAYGRILHHNLDKGLLVAGRSAPRFGGGVCIEPIKIIVCGRATNASPAIDCRGRFQDHGAPREREPAFYDRAGVRRLPRERRGVGFRQ